MASSGIIKLGEDNASKTLKLDGFEDFMDSLIQEKPSSDSYIV